MRNRTRLAAAGFGTAVLLTLVLAGGASPQRAQIPGPPAMSAADSAFDQAAALEALRKTIAGKEKSPADSVFKNIQMMKGVPAERVLRIMEMGFANSLGVRCVHCHVPGKWESDEKAQKGIARDMSAMTREINEKLLAGIGGLKGRDAKVNCTTCHRGQVKPALNLGGPPPGSPPTK